MDLLGDLRDGQSAIEQRTSTTVGVTGVTAIQTDVSDRLTQALPTYLALVIGLAFLLLMLVFRSILVPLTATLGLPALGAGHARRDGRWSSRRATSAWSRGSRWSASCRSS